MKKVFIAFLLLICGVSVINASQNGYDWPKIYFQVEIYKPITGGNPIPKSPVTLPDVYFDGYTLYIDNLGYDSTIEITDATDTVVYSVFVPAGTATVLLPSALSGSYGISLIPTGESYFFYGYIMF